MSIVIRGRNFRFFVLGSLLAFFPSCGGSPAHGASATDKSKNWYAALVVDDTDSQLRVRPNDLAADSFAAALAGRAQEEAGSRVHDAAGAALLKVFAKCDVLVVAVRKTKPSTDVIIVAGGVPSSSTPDGMVDDAQKPLWKKVDSPVTGVDEWQPTSGDEETQSGRLAVLPGNTWVIGATAASVTRMNEAFAGGAPTAYAPDSPGAGKGLFEMSLTGDALDQVRADAPPPVQAIVGTLKIAKLTVDGGSSPGAHAVLTYADGDSAAQADSTITMLTSKVPALKILGNVQIAHASSDVTLDLPISPALRDLVLAQSGTPDAPPPTADRPQEIKAPTKPKKRKGH